MGVLIENDATALVFFAMVAIPLFFANMKNKNEIENWIY